MIERATIAGEPSASGARGWPRLLCDEEQRLECFGPLACGEAEGGGEHELATATTKSGVEARVAEGTYRRAARATRRGDADGRIAIGEQLGEQVFGRAIVDARASVPACGPSGALFRLGEWASARPREAGRVRPSGSAARVSCA